MMGQACGSFLGGTGKSAELHSEQDLAKMKSVAEGVK
jgi:hypothetical protein